MSLSKLGNVMIGLGVAGLIGANAFMYVVPPGHRAIMFDQLKGVQNDVYGEGIHIRMPFIQKPVMYDIRIQPINFYTETNTNDLQGVNLTMRILYRPEEQNLPRIYNEFETDFASRFLNSVGKEVLKTVIAQYNADQLLKKREAISSEIKEKLVLLHFDT